MLFARTFFILCLGPGRPVHRHQRPTLTIPMSSGAISRAGKRTRSGPLDVVVLLSAQFSSRKTRFRSGGMRTPVLFMLPLCGRTGLKITICAIHPRLVVQAHHQKNYSRSSTVHMCSTYRYRGSYYSHICVPVPPQNVDTFQFGIACSASIGWSFLFAAHSISTSTRIQALFNFLIQRFVRNVYAHVHLPYPSYKLTIPLEWNFPLLPCPHLPA